MKRLSALIQFFHLNSNNTVEISESHSDNLNEAITPSNLGSIILSHSESVILTSSEVSNSKANKSNKARGIVNFQLTPPSDPLISLDSQVLALFTRAQVSRLRNHLFTDHFQPAFLALSMHKELCRQLAQAVDGLLRVSGWHAEMGLIDATGNEMGGSIAGPISVRSFLWGWLGGGLKSKPPVLGECEIEEPVLRIAKPSSSGDNSESDGIEFETVSLNELEHMMRGLSKVNSDSGSSECVNPSTPFRKYYNSLARQYVEFFEARQRCAEAEMRRVMKNKGSGSFLGRYEELQTLLKRVLEWCTDIATEVQRTEEGIEQINRENIEPADATAGNWSPLSTRRT